MPRGCCTVLNLRVDNARFVLLGFLLLIYMLLGAGVFVFLERSTELAERQQYKEDITWFRTRFMSCNQLNETHLQWMLDKHAEAYTSGLLEGKRHRWDYSGAFYFVGTVISTIGFGMTTPHTAAGKAVMIAYGFIGCSGAILFFNLFLERIITFWAFMLKNLHILKRDRRKSDDALSPTKDRRASSTSTDEESLEQWKPSVYSVQFLLLITSCIIALCASSVFYKMENWAFIDSLYFCFVAFATIGFGDFVTSQLDIYAESTWYRVLNFILISLGCCCLYSFFNVTSLVIRKLLDAVIRKLDIDCDLYFRCCSQRRNCRAVPQMVGNPSRKRRNAISTDNFRQQSVTASRIAGRLATSVRSMSIDSNYDSEDNGERGSSVSDEMISMTDFFQNNKVALAMIQKRLYETSERGKIARGSDGFSTGVGPLAIVNQKFGQENI